MKIRVDISDGMRFNTRAGRFVPGESGLTVCVKKYIFSQQTPLAELGLGSARFHAPVIYCQIRVRVPQGVFVSMSIKIMSAVWDSSVKTQSDKAKTRHHAKKLVLLALADNANDDGVCWPSIKTLARKCDLSPQGVLNQLEQLVDEGRIEVERSNGKRSNRYTVLVGQRPMTLTVDKKPTFNVVDQQRSTSLTPTSNVVDTNRKEPSVEPSISPSSKASDFLKAWSAAFREDLNQPAVLMPADRQAARQFFTNGVGVAEAIATQRRAWKLRGDRTKFYCSKCSTAKFFLNHYHEIKAEVTYQSPRKSAIQSGVCPAHQGGNF